MNTQALELTRHHNIPVDPLPQTARGRALYTVDWFLNGKPVLRNHDDPQLNFEDAYRR